MENGDAGRTNHDLRRTSTRRRDQRQATGAVRALGSESLSAAVSSDLKGPAYSVRRALSPWVATAPSASVSKAREPARDTKTISPSSHARKMWTSIGESRRGIAQVTRPAMLPGACDAV
jgi:hypothetical protein